MSETALPNPDLFIARDVLLDAWFKGAETIETDRAAIDEVVHFSRQDHEMPPIGTIIVRPHAEVLFDAMGSGKPGQYFHIPQQQGYDASIETALTSKPHILSNIRLSAYRRKTESVTIHATHATEEKLARGLYTATRRWKGPTAHVSKEAVIGSLTGAGAGLLSAIVETGVGQETWQEYLAIYGIDVTLGLIAGRLAIAPFFGQLRKNHDMKIIRQNPPFKVTVKDQAAT